jgi:hypothetical protein
MVFYFSPRNHKEGSQDYLIYMGRDKYVPTHSPRCGCMLAYGSILQ